MIDIESVKIGALLHDIGKPLVGRKEFIGKTHSRIGYELLQPLKSLLGEKSLKAVLYHMYEERKRECIDYNKLDDECIIVDIADNLASASDREEKESDEKSSYIIDPITKKTVEPYLHGIKHLKNLPLYLSKIPNFNKSIILSKILLEPKPSNGNNSEVKSGLSEITKLLKKWRASYYSPNHSLYHHIKLTAAIATCIAYDMKNGIINIENVKNYDVKFALVSGDIRGIQNFISQSRKFRDLHNSSQIIMDVINNLAECIESKYGIQNVLYKGGGNFLVLLPYSEYEKDIEKLENRFQQYLSGMGWKKGIKKPFSVLFSVSILRKTGSENKTNSHEISNFGKCWERLQKISFYGKSRGFKKIIEKNYHEIDDYFPDIVHARQYEEFICSLCGEREGMYKTDKEKREILCEICYRKRNRKTRTYVDLGEIAIASIKDKVINFMGVKEFEKIVGKSINDISYDDLIKIKENITKKNVKKEVKEFFAKLKIPKEIAVLKIDGDNLGRWFSGKGIKEECEKEKRRVRKTTEKGKEEECKVTIATISYLSEQIKSLERDIIKTIKKCKGECVYTGGDDTLAVLPLSQAVRCAMEVNELFRKRFTGTDNEQKITISAGIFVCDHHFHLRFALEEAEKMLSTSKGEGKNKCTIGVMGKVGNYITYEWKELERLWNGINLIKIPRNELYKLRTILHSKSDETEKLNEIRAFLIYQLSRKKEDEIEEFRNFVEFILREIKNDGIRFLNKFFQLVEIKTEEVDNEK